MSSSVDYSATYDTQVELDYRRGRAHSPDVTLVARAVDVDPVGGEQPDRRPATREEARHTSRQQFSTRVFARNLVQPILQELHRRTSSSTPIRRGGNVTSQSRHFEQERESDSRHFEQDQQSGSRRSSHTMSLAEQSTINRSRVPSSPSPRLSLLEESGIGDALRGNYADRMHSTTLPRAIIEVDQSALSSDEETAVESEIAVNRQSGQRNRQANASTSSSIGSRALRAAVLAEFEEELKRRQIRKQQRRELESTQRTVDIESRESVASTETNSSEEVTLPHRLPDFDLHFDVISNEWDAERGAQRFEFRGYAHVLHNETPVVQGDRDDEETQGENDETIRETVESVNEMARRYAADNSRMISYFGNDDSALPPSSPVVDMPNSDNADVMDEFVAVNSLAQSFVNRPGIEVGDGISKQAQSAVRAIAHAHIQKLLKLSGTRAQSANESELRCSHIQHALNNNARMNIYGIPSPSTTQSSTPPSTNRVSRPSSTPPFTARDSRTSSTLFEWSTVGNGTQLDRLPIQRDRDVSPFELPRYQLPSASNTPLPGWNDLSAIPHRPVRRQQATSMHSAPPAMTEQAASTSMDRSRPAGRYRHVIIHPDRQGRYGQQ